ncbi:mannose-1-phosphate guanylyltransferase [candidate division WWE3 bacterium]|uniref:Mannose-1-phosphate guanylyltransferase n=1 Tax=candidate division WWE3 bacterium TaxID=2053526 RepID=A0A955LK20_UNCKA|nr:mannose-1-phosphate guanylyltransferase [candidate division WWE3 bacterium]
MKIIIFAGGTGKRFWPASRKQSPKQFLPVIGDQPLLLLKYEYLRRGFEAQDIFISTGIQYENEVRDLIPELPDENFIFEPMMRDTGPAIALASCYVNKLFPDETISLQWSDHYIKRPDVFVSALKEAERLVNEEGRAVNIAEKPRFPTPHRGYLKYGKHIKSVNQHHVLCEFVRFMEKPTLKVAKEYLRSGDYSWNLGYWVLKPKHLFAKYKDFAPQILSVAEEIVNSDFSKESTDKFAELDKTSFEYIFSENCEPSETYVMNTNMGWYDVGEWISLKETLEEDPQDVVTQGNVIDIDSKDTLIYNSSQKSLVATINLDGLVVVNTDDVVAIFPKDDNAQLKELLKRLEENGREEYL